MVRALALAALALSACAMPEDQFLLEGTVIGSLYSPAAGVEVRLLREQSRDGLRCVPMLDVLQTTTDQNGQYRFELIRQQLTMGAPQNRAFRVEVGERGVLTSSFTFRFPSVDLRLPVLPLPVEGMNGPLGRDTAEEVETFVDGYVAWRGSAAAGGDREATSRRVSRQANILTLTRDAVGGTEDLMVEWRLEHPLEPRPASGATPVSRGAACDVGPDGGPCPLTDGRYLPFVFPPGAKGATVTLADNLSIGAVAVHGLLLGGEAVVARLDVSFDDVTPPAPFLRFGMSIDAQRFAAASCEEPGEFFALPVNLSFPRPKRLRLRFLDANDTSVELRSLSEVSVFSQ